MPALKSLEDLKRIREEALQKRQAKITTGQVKVVVGMGTCGIAAGARETMKAILETIEQDKLSGIVVTQTGCIGKCEYEPIVEVTVGDAPQAIYGKVTPDKARRILQEHAVKGNAVREYLVPASQAAR
jgi:NADP-reducing hydrogenase subunit HndB